MLCLQGIVAVQPQAFLAPHLPTVDCKKIASFGLSWSGCKSVGYKLHRRRCLYVTGCILGKAVGSPVQWSEDSCVEIPAEEARQAGNATGGEPFLFLLNVKCQNWTSYGVTAEDKILLDCTHLFRRRQSAE